MKVSSATLGKLGLLGSLYFSQGLPFGFFTQALPVLLRQKGFSLEQVGMSSLLALPWALKFLWAPVVDRVFIARIGARRSWILPLQFAASLALVIIATVVSEEQLQHLMIGVFALNMIAATQDIATDGLAVELLAPGERGFANGLQVAGYRVGMVIGGGVLLITYDTLGWMQTFVAMALMTALATIPVLAFREPPRPPTHIHPSFGSSLFHFFREAAGLRVILLLVVYKFGDAFAVGMLRPFLTDRGLGVEDIGWLLGTVGFVAGLLGALSGGALVNRVGRHRALILFGLLQALTVGAYAIVAAMPFSRRAIYALCAAEHFAGGMATAALFTCMMDWCRTTAAGSDYTVQASTVVIATGLASALSGFSAQALGYPLHFAISAVLAAASLLAVMGAFPRQAESDLSQ